MDVKAYFQLMEETGRETYRKVEDILNREIEEYSLKEFIKKFMHGRLKNKRRLRSLLVRGVYKAVKGNDDWLSALDICAGFELWLIADYLTNDVFDNKLNKCHVEIEKDSNLFYMASSVMREISEKTLRDVTKELKPEKEAEVTELFSELVKNAYMHQWIDYIFKYKGESPEELKERIEDLFEKRYIKYEAGNCFGKICEISAILFGADKNCIRNLKNYGKEFSAALQIVNDIADIADGNYDLKNKLLTYPLVLTMVKTKQNVYEMPEEIVRKLFVGSRAFDKCRKIAIGIAKKAKKYLRESFDPERRDILSTALALIRSNKYYKILKKENSLLKLSDFRD